MIAVYTFYWQCIKYIRLARDVVRPVKFKYFVEDKIYTFIYYMMLKIHTSDWLTASTSSFNKSLYSPRKTAREVNITFQWLSAVPKTNAASFRLYYFMKRQDTNSKSYNKTINDFKFGRYKVYLPQNKYIYLGFASGKYNILG